MAVETSHIILHRDSTFLWEVWIWFGIGVIAILLRFAVRIRTVGIRQFDGDDYFAFGSLVMYTADAVLVDIVYRAGSNVDVPLDMIDSLTYDEVVTIRWGSKCQLTAWYTYTALIWFMKFQLLFFYRRLTMGTFQARLIKYLFWICAITYIAIFLTLTFGCFPFSQNWAVRPLPPRQCTFRPQNFYVGTILNVLTDAMILIIPIPLLWRLKVPLSKKIAISALLSSGLFVITAAIVRAVLTLGATPSAITINRWGVRETIVGILTVNLPILRPLFTRAFWRWGTYIGQSKGLGSSGFRGASEQTAGKSKGKFEIGFASAVVGRGDRRRSDKMGDFEEGDSVRTSSLGSHDGIMRKVDSRELECGVVVVEQSFDVRIHDRGEDDDVGNWSYDGKCRGFDTKISVGKQSTADIV